MVSRDQHSLGSAHSTSLTLLPIPPPRLPRNLQQSQQETPLLPSLVAIVRQSSEQHPTLAQQLDALLGRTLDRFLHLALSPVRLRRPLGEGERNANQIQHRMPVRVTADQKASVPSASRAARELTPSPNSYLACPTPPTILRHSHSHASARPPSSRSRVPTLARTIAPPPCSQNARGESVEPTVPPRREEGGRGG